MGWSLLSVFGTGYAEWRKGVYRREKMWYNRGEGSKFFKLQFTGDKPQPRRAGDRATVTKNKRLPSLGKGEGNFGV
jgi:hypothetical protein